MGKIIIQNESDLDIVNAIELVKDVIARGKISNNGTQYCYLSVFKLENRLYYVYAIRNGKSDKFQIM